MNRRVALASASLAKNRLTKSQLAKNQLAKNTWAKNKWAKTALTGSVQAKSAWARGAMAGRSTTRLLPANVQALTTKRDRPSARAIARKIHKNRLTRLTLYQTLYQARYQAASRRASPRTDLERERRIPWEALEYSLLPEYFAKCKLCWRRCLACGKGSSSGRDKEESWAGGGQGWLADSGRIGGG